MRKGKGLNNPLHPLYFDCRVFVSVRARDDSSRSWADFPDQRSPLSIRGHIQHRVRFSGRDSLRQNKHCEGSCELLTDFQTFELF